MPQPNKLHTARYWMRASASALLVGASLLPGSATAQTLEIDADGDRVSATSQSQAHADILSVAQAVVPPPTVETLVGSTLRLAANTARASASANAVESRIEDEGVDRSVRGSRAGIRPEGASADGALVSIAAQSMRDSRVFAQSMQTLPVATIGSVEASALIVADNVQRADGRGNDRFASVGLAGSGGLIANLQDQDAASGVRGVLSDIVSLSADRVAQSGVAVTANTQQATAVANNATLGLAVSGPGEAAEPVAAPMTRVDAFEVSVQADQAALSRQRASGHTIAMAGQPGSPTGTRMVIGSLDGSDVTIAANRRAALSSGNDVRADIEIDAVAGSASGRSAAVAIDQQVDGQALAIATGADHVQVSGLVERASISLSDNEVDSRASGNVAETGLLMRGATIGAASGPGQPPAGTALVGHDGSRTTSAPYALHTDNAH